MKANIELTENDAEFRLKNYAETRAYSQSLAMQAISANRKPRLVRSAEWPQRQR